MKWKTDINTRAFNALIDGTKTIEVRTKTSNDKLDCLKVVAGDIISFDTYPMPSERMIVCEVKRIAHYKSAFDLYSIEGIDKTTSSKPDSIEEAITSIEQFSEYKENIKIFGIWAIEVINVKIVQK